MSGNEDRSGTLVTRGSAADLDRRARDCHLNAAKSRPAPGVAIATAGDEHPIQRACMELQTGELDTNSRGNVAGLDRHSQLSRLRYAPPCTLPRLLSFWTSMAP